MHQHVAPINLRKDGAQMTAEDHTLNTPQLPVENVNEALKTRWRYFRSIGGTMALACLILPRLKITRTLSK